jgi:hypothetical protein
MGADTNEIGTVRKYRKKEYRHNKFRHEKYQSNELCISSITLAVITYFRSKNVLQICQNILTKCEWKYLAFFAIVFFGPVQPLSISSNTPLYYLPSLCIAGRCSSILAYRWARGWGVWSHIIEQQKSLVFFTLLFHAWDRLVGYSHGPNS